jgi:hypothetical protein
VDHAELVLADGKVSLGGLGGSALSDATHALVLDDVAPGDGQTGNNPQRRSQAEKRRLDDLRKQAITRFEVIECNGDFTPV